MPTRHGGAGEGLGGFEPDDLDTVADLEPLDGPLDLEEPFDDDGVADAALFLPFRDGRPGWR